MIQCTISGCQIGVERIAARAVFKADKSWVRQSLIVGQKFGSLWGQSTKGHFFGESEWLWNQNEAGKGSKVNFATNLWEAWTTQRLEDCHRIWKPTNHQDLHKTQDLKSWTFLDQTSKKLSNHRSGCDQSDQSMLLDLRPSAQHSKVNQILTIKIVQLLHQMLQQFLSEFCRPLLKGYYGMVIGEVFSWVIFEYFVLICAGSHFLPDTRQPAYKTTRNLWSTSEFITAS